MQQLASMLAHNPWLGVLAIALAAVVAALVVHHVAGALLRRHSVRTPVIHAVLTAVEHAAGAVLPLLALQLVWQAAPDNLPHMAGVRHVNGVLLIAAVTWLAIRVIRGFADGIVARNPVGIQDNLQARRIQTQATVLARSAMVLVAIAGAAMALMTFPGARQLGASLLASAGVIGIVGGLAARPVFSNLIAGLQLALAQPIRLDDVLIVKGEWGRVEEITGTYVVLKIWDERRLIIPLQWFIENPFENWTRTSSQILGTVFLWLDFATPLEPLRAEVARLVEADPDWDRRVCTVVVLETSERAMQIRILVSAQSSGQAFDLRCRIREGAIAFLARECPQALPRVRVEQEQEWVAARPPAAPPDRGPAPGPTA
jgi:small-conductance mechanosensitive channel